MTASSANTNNNKKKQEESYEPQVVVQHMGIPAGPLSSEEVEWIKAEYPHYGKLEDKALQTMAGENSVPTPEAPAPNTPTEPEGVVIARRALQEVMSLGAPQAGAITAAAGALEAALAEAQAEVQRALDLEAAKQQALEAASEAQPGTVAIVAPAASAGAASSASSTVHKVKSK